MAGAYFDMEVDDIQKLQDSIKQFDGDAETVINDYLNSEAKDIFINSIINYIPVSEKGTNHARVSEPLKGDMKGNLTLYIHTKSKYNYLYFPQEGEGTSKRKSPNDFMEKGIDDKYENVVNGILEKLQNRMEGI